MRSSLLPAAPAPQQLARDAREVGVLRAGEEPADARGFDLGAPQGPRRVCGPMGTVVPLEGARARHPRETSLAPSPQAGRTRGVVAACTARAACL